ncbi:MAG: GH32 C-terminal domain-containing protein [Ginsengibacter sp.]
MRHVILFSFIVFLSANSYAQYNEKYRPQYHFSPQKSWIGDPDGLVKWKGLYHLFWWGHAVSSDLIHWKELPYPMKGGDNSFHYFSGSVVVDKNNTAGFGDSTMIAVYTAHKNDNVPEYQAISYSNNDTIFNYYKNNPVLDIKSNSFRDPQVFWYAPEQQWIMIVTHPHLHKVSFYASPDLKQWKYLSEFGPMAAHDNDWEVPDFFQLPVDDDASNKKWVLTIGQGPNRMQYFLGDFEGEKFIPDAQTIEQNKKQDDALWIDYGADYYAARTWRNIDDSADKNIIMLAWMGNWSYAGNVPSKWGKGFETIPRNVCLKTFKQGVRLVQSPIEALKILRKDSVQFSNKQFNKTFVVNEFQPKQNTYELETTIDMGNATIVGLNVLVGEERKLIIGYDKSRQRLFIDRTKCSDFTTDSVFNKKFPIKVSAPLVLKNDKLTLHIFVDASSVEVFANDGEITMSCTTFPSSAQTGITFFGDGKSSVQNFKAWMLDSIWK